MSRNKGDMDTTTTIDSKTAHTKQIQTTQTSALLNRQSKCINIPNGRNDGRNGGKNNGKSNSNWHRP
eukprot:793915-Ditylum_brightwellii.AAC.1